ncbi:baculoviral IAP repeat-containing protein 7-B-like [Cloeon dipterum]|uniref:baculoviral IAP repeat-containing protein 7-B-like n=1 Tax=Cloeon dipterum TaxID=197152 RepID=UPI00321FAED3
MGVPGVPAAKNLKLKLILAMHRYFTYPLDFHQSYTTDLIISLSELGLYYRITGECEFLHCNFCQLKISREKFEEYLSKGSADAKNTIYKRQKDLKCKLLEQNSENLPMGQNVESKLNHKFEAHRLYSLLQKLDWQFVEPFGLARSGFYYTGYGDNVRCTFCNLEVCKWGAGDTPDGEHKRWNSKCPFMLKNHIVPNIEIGSEQLNVSHDCLSAGHRPCHISNPFASNETQFKEYGPNFKFVITLNHFLITPNDLNIKNWSSPFHPRYATLSSRNDSFKDSWPKSCTQTPLELARAGFYSTGIEDQVICFHCNVALKDWAENDDPFILHCKWNQNCQYLLMCKGSDFVQQVLYPNKNREITNSSTENKGDGDMCCKKCKLNIVSKVNLPCGHMTFCSTCSSEESCTVCNRDIISEIKVLGFSFSETEKKSNEEQPLESN